MQRLTSFIYPIFLLLLLTLGQLLTLLPLWMYQTGSSERVRATLQMPALLTFQVGCLILHSAIILAILSLLVRLPKIGRAACAMFLFLELLILTAAVMYLVKLGGYPGEGVLREFLASPKVFSEYGSSGVEPYDLIIFLITLFVSSTLSLVATTRWYKLESASSRLTPIVIGALVGFLLAALPFIRNINAKELALGAHYGTPMARYYGAAFAELNPSAHDMSLSLLEHYLPLTKPQRNSDLEQRPRHILLIIAESIRADRTPFYGYPEPTMPKLAAKAQDWVVFKRAYAHGSGTSMSFPVIFTSRYLAMVEQNNSNATLFWRSLNKGGWRTGFFSAGAMRWGGIDDFLQIKNADTYFHADESSPDQKLLRVTSRLHDYAVRDEVVMERYLNFLDAAPKDTSSFSVIHFVGSHYPYDISPEFNHFKPAATLNDWTLNINTLGRPTDVSLIHNAYQNSLQFVDSNIDQLIGELSKRNILENSVIIFTADHGESFGEHGALFHALNLYNDQIKVPLVVRVGSALPQIRDKISVHTENTRGLVDILPTVLDLAGRRIPPPFQGRSLLHPDPKPYEMSVYKFNSDKAAVIKDNTKFIFDGATRESAVYNLAVDPAESKNLWIKPVTTLREFLNVLKNKKVLE